MTKPYTIITHQRGRALLHLVALVCLLAGATTHAADLILNGSFEDPVEPGSGFFPATPTDWTGGAHIVQGTLGGWPPPEDGIQFDGLTSGPALSQVVNILHAGSYTLTWYDNANIGVAHTYEVLLNGSIEETLSGTGSQTWTPRSLALDLGAGDNTLAFEDVTTGGGGTNLIDNVHLEATSATPDGGLTIGMLGVAMGGLAFIRRKL